MGVTVSHTAFSPLSMVSTIIGFISFTFTLATLLKVSWSNLATFNAAPEEIKDTLSSLKQGLLEERRHLRRVRKRLRNVRRDQSHGPSARSDSEEYDRGEEGRRRSRRGKGGHKRRTMHFDRDMQSMRSSGEAEALSVMRVTIRDLIQKFRDLEYPFLKPEYQSQDSAQWSTQSSPYPSERSPYAAQYYPHSDDDDDDSPSAGHMRKSNRLGLEYANCDLQRRWLWVRRKADVINLSTVLSRVEGRRTAHEVGEVFSMVSNIGRDVEDLRGVLEGVEARLNRVVGIRRVD
ncbi:hypothetical protein BKA58DRAFT_409132 [Alternaria rosae]|uniref:uncharacterized protein n=1 Tax=Alternaria rosae TaxID=1187941 RepID=UPI001E8ED6E1|nr:uncharacterized protein BKA58DRAFT_409132 [Alternaria rosae]KAH6878713.1 hypothetical protein BKA58DRAFT_409132 [Alternaria rosae]